MHFSGSCITRITQPTSFPIHAQNIHEIKDVVRLVHVITEAIHSENMPILTEFRDHTLFLSALAHHQDQNGDTLLHTAISHRNPMIAMGLFDSIQFDPNENSDIYHLFYKSNQAGISVIDTLFASGSPVLIRMIVDLYGDELHFDIKNAAGKSPIHYLIERFPRESHIPFSDIISKLYDRIEDSLETEVVFTLVKGAMQANDYEVLEKFLNNPGYLDVLASKDENQNTLLHLAAAHPNPAIAIKLLDHIDFDTGLNPELGSLLTAKNSDGDTIFHIAAQKRNIPLIHFLLNMHAEYMDLNLRNSLNESAFDICMRHGAEFINQLPFEIQEKMRFQKAQYKLIEDFVHPDAPIFMNQATHFKADADRVSAELGVNIHYIFTPNDKFIWFRDYFHTSFDADGSLVTRVVADQRTFDYTSVIHSYFGPPQFNQEDAISLFRNERIAGIFKQSGASPFSDGPVPLAGAVAFIPEQIQRGILMGVLQSNSLHHREKTTALEGGNLIKAINSQGDLKFIVGESAIVHSAMYYRTNSTVGAASPSYQQYRQAIEPTSKGIRKGIASYAAAPDVVDAQHAARLAERRTAEKYRVAHELNQGSQGIFHKESARNVIVVPQWTYHIDLQMSYLGNGKVLVHSFESTLEFLAQNKAQVLAELNQLIQTQAISWTGSAEDLFQKIVHVNIELARTYEKSIVDEIGRKLEKHGLSMTKCCGNLFTDFPIGGSPGGDLLGCFMNGLGGHSSKTDRDYFLTARSPLASFERYFAQQILAPMGIDCRFLNMVPKDPDDTFVPQPGSLPMDPDMESAINTVKAIGSLSGSFRCQTTVADPAVVSGQPLP